MFHGYDSCPFFCIWKDVWCCFISPLLCELFISWYYANSLSHNIDLETQKGAVAEVFNDYSNIFVSLKWPLA